MNKMSYEINEDDELISRHEAQEHLMDVDIPYLGINANFAREWAVSELNNVNAYNPRWDYKYCGNCGGLKDYCALIQYCCSNCTHSLI